MSNVTLQDFDAVVRMIDVVTARGAIRGNELTAVGTLREKFTEVLEEEMKRQQEAQNGAPAAPLAPTDNMPAVDSEKAEETITLN